MNLVKLHKLEKRFGFSTNWNNLLHIILHRNDIINLMSENNHNYTEFCENLRDLVEYAHHMGSCDPYVKVKKT